MKRILAALALLFLTPVSLYAFPTVVNCANSVTSTDSTGHTVSLPATIVSGRTLVAWFAADGNETVTFPGGWTKIKEINAGVTLAIAWRKATGSEGSTMTVNTGTFEESSHMVCQISSATDPDVTPPEVSTGTSGISATPDPDSLTPTGGGKDYLWFAAMATDQGGLASGVPSNYSDGETYRSNSVGGSSATIALARRELNATSENPGQFTIPGSDEWVAATVAVYPVVVTQAKIRPQTIVVIAKVPPGPPPPPAADLYAGPAGSGSVCSKTNPCTSAQLISQIQPDQTGEYLAGTYTGPSAMIDITDKSGTEANPFTLRCEIDGACFINGQGARGPIQLLRSDWWILEGFNAANSNDNPVVALFTGSDHNIIRRVVAWNAPENENRGVFNCNTNTGNLFEDIAGFGTGRNIVSTAQGCDNATIRRAWGRWQRSLVVGPKVAVSVGYNSINVTAENIIATWDESDMGGASINQPQNVITFGPQITGITCPDNKILGSIAYILASAEADQLTEGLFGGNNDAGCYRFEHVISHVAPGTHTNLKPFVLLNESINHGSKFLTRATQIGGATSTIGSQWTQSGNLDLDSVPTGSTNIWDGSSPSGARVCKRYKDGVLTSTPLWPWPMNQRIIDAMQAAGETPVDVTATMEQQFGTIPAECRNDA